MNIDVIEIVKESFRYLRNNHQFLVLGFLMSIAGGGWQIQKVSFGLWMRNPIPPGMTGYSPLYRFAHKVVGSASGNLALKLILITVGILVGLIAFFIGVYASACLIIGVSRISDGEILKFRETCVVERNTFLRYLFLSILYVAALIIVVLPLILLIFVFGRGRYTLIPCLSTLILGTFVVLAFVFLGIVFEISGRFLLLQDMGIFGSISRAIYFLRDYFIDCLLLWGYEFLIEISGIISVVLALVFLGIPLTWLSQITKAHHNPILISLDIIAFLAVWFAVSTLNGGFLVVASSAWTCAFKYLTS